MFSCDISKILKNTYFQEHLRTTASLLQQQFHPFFPTVAARFSKQIASTISLAYQIFSDILNLIKQPLMNNLLGFHRHKIVFNSFLILLNIIVLHIYGVFFCSVFFCIRSEYKKIRTRKNSVFGYFSRREKDDINDINSFNKVFIIFPTLLSHYRNLLR